MKIKMIVLFILLASVLTFSQQTQRYFDTPFGGGGGYVPGWYISDLALVNEKLRGIGVPELNEGVFSSGGAGFIYLGLIPNFRIGGMGFGGGTSSDVLDGNISKEAKYSVGGGGLTIEYTLPFIKGFGVSVGAILGAASQHLEIYKRSGSFNWDDIWEEVGSNGLTRDYSRILENNYWIFSPTLNIDIPFYRFFIFRLGAGYNFTAGNDWQVENNVEISGVPTKNLNGDSFFIQSGIFIGFFSF